MSTTLFLKTPENFSFQNTIYSHGWCELLPFEIDEEKKYLSRVFTDENTGQHTFAKISEAENGLQIESSSESFSKEKLLRDVLHILRFDENLNEFYKLTDKEKSLKWIAQKNAGRLLRSPTVFEDLVKTICTTNCSWSLTKIMVKNLVEKLGKPIGDGKFSFPNAEALASVSEQFYREEIRAGYRSPYFAELAEKVADGKLNPEKWLNSELNGKDLKKEMKQVKGVGDYAAENLLKLVGNYEGLALDSWVRAQFYRKHNGEEVCEDAKIKEFYAKFGKWQGLAVWCDVTEKWF